MAFFTKTDYCGLSELDGFLVKDDTANETNEKYQPQGGDGSYIATEVYGSDASPTNNYGVSSNVSILSGEIMLGQVSTVDGKKYALETVTINTGAATPPTVAATSQLVESNANDAQCCHYAVPAFALTTKQHAQILFSAFTLSGVGCNLTDCAATIGCSVSKDKLAGNIIASDVNSGIITVTGTVLQANVVGSQSPTITPSAGWVLTSKPTCSNPETAYKSYTFEVQKVLSKS